MREVGICIVPLFCSLALAEDAESPSPSAPVESQAAADESAGALAELFGGERLTGDWLGGRSALEEHGLTIDLGLTTIFQQNARGGLKTHNAHRITGSFDLEMTLDLEKLARIPGATVYAWAEMTWDEGISERYVGDLFGVNYDAVGDLPIALRELWYEQQLGDHVRLRVGRLWLGEDFDLNAYANDETSQFINSGLVNAPSIPFPDYGNGVQLFIEPCEWFYFGALAADAHADGEETGFETTFHGPADFVSMFELGFLPKWESSSGRLPGGYRFGLWYDPQSKEVFFDDLDGRRRTIPHKRDDLGFYSSFDQLVWREPTEDAAESQPASDESETEEDESPQGLGVFARYAYAPGDVNEIEHFWSAGFQYQGAIPRRDDDVLGFGVASGRLSRNLELAGWDPHTETVLETYYRAQVFPWLGVSPHVQWVLTPGGENGRDALVFGVRLQATF